MKKILRQSIMLAFFLLSIQAIMRINDFQRSRIQIKNSLISVSETYSNEFEDLEKGFFSVRVIQRSSKSVDIKMVLMQDKIEMILRKFGIHNHDSLLVKAKFHPQFKDQLKKWSSQMIFLIIADEHTLYKCQKQFRSIGIERINHHPSIIFLNEMIRSVNVFKKAEASLIKALQVYPQISIKSLDYIDLIGDNIKNEELLERHIQMQYNGNFLMLKQEDLARVSIHEESQCEERQFRIKAVFKIGQIQDSTDESSQMQSDDYGSDSDSFY